MSRDDRGNKGNETPDRPGMAHRAQRRRDAGIRWAREDHQVAARIAPGDLLGLLHSGLEIQPGTRALLFEGGRYRGTLSTGRHVIGGLAEKLGFRPGGEAFAIVVDTGELGLEFEVSGLVSKDRFKVVLNSEASLRLSEPEIFLANLMRDRLTFSVADLVERVSSEIRQTVEQLVAEHGVEDLRRGRVRDRVEMTFLKNLKPTLDRTGFLLNRFRALDFHAPDLDDANGIEGQTAGAVAVRRAASAAARAYFEEELREIDAEILRLDKLEEARERHRRVALSHQAEQEKIEVGHELDSLEGDANRLERRLPLLERLLKGKLLEKMTHLRNAEEWRRFRAQVDRDHLLDEHEWSELQKDADAQAEEAQLKRHFQAERVRVMHDSDLEELKLKRAHQLELLKMRGDAQVTEEKLRVERTKLDAELEVLDKRSEAELKKRNDWFRRELEEREELSAQKMSEQEREIALAERLRKLNVWTVQQFEEIRQMSKDRKVARELEVEVRRAELEVKKGQASAEAEDIRLGHYGDITMGRTPEEIIALIPILRPEQAGTAASTMRALKAADVTENERERERAQQDKRREERLYCRIHDLHFIGEPCPDCSSEWRKG